MHIGFDGVVHGICGINDCVLVRSGPCAEYGEEIMRSCYGNKSFCVCKKGEQENCKVICPCCVVRLFGVGLVGGGVLCKVLKVLWRHNIYFYGASVSECGIALALPNEEMNIALSVLSEELLEREEI